MIDFTRRGQAPRIITIAFVLAFLLPAPVFAQRLGTDEFKNGETVKAAFKEVVRRTRDSTVQVLVDGRVRAHGAVIRSDGLVLTKASELGDSDNTLECRLVDRRELKAKVVARDDRYDLALLQISARALPTVRWSEEDVSAGGSWVATPGLDRLPIAVGVVSGPARSIPGSGGFLGVMIEDAPEERAPRIAQVLPDTAADEAGFRVGDIVTHVGDARVTDREALVDRIGTHQPGSVVPFRIRRGERNRTLEATLGQRTETDRVSRRSQGSLSRRRSGFPRAFAHDSVLRPRDCGGPLVNLDGRVVGINIARAGRTESYALPAKTVQERLRSLIRKAAGTKKPEVF